MLNQTHPAKLGELLSTKEGVLRVCLYVCVCACAVRVYVCVCASLGILSVLAATLEEPAGVVRPQAVS